MGMRGEQRGDVVFILSGVAVRLARKMGLHRDGTALNLLPFETEMRRRLWWHIVQVDFHIADLLGTKPSMDLFSHDVKMPLNVEDEDLVPDMTDPPPERNGITSAVICLLRCEIIEFLRKFSSSFPRDVRWEILTTADITPAKKNSMISQVEDHLETKYLRYCDPSNPLHNFTSIMVRSSIAKMKLLAHNPRRFVNPGANAPQSEQDIVFANATKLLEYATLIRSNPNLKKYTWQNGTGFLCSTFLYTLIEARHRRIGPEADRLWQLIGVVLSTYPQIYEEPNGTMYAALGKWTLGIWDEYVTAMKAEGFLEPPTPQYINEIRSRQESSRKFSFQTTGPTDSRPTTRNSTGYSKIQSLRHDGNPFSDFDLLDSFDYPNLPPFEMEPNEWLQWGL
jgi:hypothetical protein